MNGEHLDIQVLMPAIELLVFDADIREMNLFVEVRQVVLLCPLLDVALVAIGMTVVVVAVTIALVQPLLVITLELVVQDHSFDPCSTLLQAFGLTFEGTIDLGRRARVPFRV